MGPLGKRLAGFPEGPKEIIFTPRPEGCGVNQVWGSGKSFPGTANNKHRGPGSCSGGGGNEEEKAGKKAGSSQTMARTAFCDTVKILDFHLKDDTRRISTHFSHQTINA